MTQTVNEWSRVLGTTLHPEVSAELRRLAKLSPHAEICGFIIDGDQILSVANEAADPSHAWRISAEESVKINTEYGERISGLFHSHPSGRPYMSPTDVANARELYQAGCPWKYIIVTPEAVTEYRWVGS